MVGAVVLSPNGAQQGATTATAPVLPMVPFTRAAKPHAEPFFDQTFTLGTTSVNVGPVDIVSYGFYRRILVSVVIASSGNTATVTLGEDAPWSTFGEIAVQDVNSGPLYGPVDGFSAYLLHRFGGYVGQEDPESYPATVYTALTTGAGATAGSGRFMFAIPAEINGRDGLGSLANMNASATYKLRATLNPLASIFGVVPSGTVTARVTLTLEAWSQPDPFDIANRPQATVPPANGTTQFWSRSLPPINTGAQTVRHTRIGNYIRNLIYVFRSGGLRSTGETNMPPNWQWYVDSRLIRNYSLPELRGVQWENYSDVSGGTEPGVVVWPMDTEFNGKAGFELRDLWLPTTQATRLEVQATFGAAGTLTILTNDVAPRGEVFL
jgi:hypothetical protein